MANFDIPSEEELNPMKVHDYNLLPKEYNIDENESTNTYDQFLMLRDTLVYTKKTYSGKAGSVLVIGDKEDTVEVIIRNRFIQKLNPNRESDPNDVKTTLQGPYVTQAGINTATYGYASCKVTKAGYYKVTYKIELENIPSGTTRIRAYVERLPMNSQGGYGAPGSGNPVALYDDQSGSISFDQMYSKKTVIGTVDTNLEKGDLLRFVVEDQSGNSLPIRQYRSNRWTVDYINLPLND